MCVCLHAFINLHTVAACMWVFFFARFPLPTSRSSSHPLSYIACISVSLVCVPATVFVCVWAPFLSQALSPVFHGPVPRLCSLLNFSYGSRNIKSRTQQNTKTDQAETKAHSLNNMQTCVRAQVHEHTHTQSNLSSDRDWWCGLGWTVFLMHIYRCMKYKMFGNLC